MNLLSAILTFLVLAVNPSGHVYVPKGTLKEVFYKTSVPGPTQRKMRVYLPEGYEDSDERYPVIYLLHGARGNEDAWVKNGNILQVADSLQSNGYSKRFILVMPNMNQYKDDDDYKNSRLKRAFESIFDVDGTVESAFPNDVVKFIDSEFRTIPDKRHRAIAGLSLGGLQSIFLGANNPDLFDYFGLFSPTRRTALKPSEYNEFYSYLKDKLAVQFADPPRLYMICIGKKDIFFQQMRSYRRYLRKQGYNHVYFETPGGHNWNNWKPYCTFFMQECFK